MILDLNSNAGGTLKSLFTPIIPAGTKDREKKWTKGNQYQKWVNISIPTQAPNFGTPDSEANLIVEFLPPVSKIPAAIKAPYLHKISSCFLV